MSPEEGALLAQYASERDAEAFRTLVERHQRMVYGACLRVLGNAADAEDAAQDVFLKLARHAGRLRAPIAAWLHKVAVRVALEMARKEQRHQVKAGHAMARTGDRTEPTWDDVKEHVDGAIGALPGNLRHAIVLHFLEGRKQEDVAQEIGVTQATVSRWIQSAVTALRSHLARKGVAMSVAALAGMLSANAVEAAVPLTLTAALGKMALAGPTTLKGAIIMKISAVTLVAAAAVTAGVVALNSGAQPQPPPPPPAAISQPASPSGVVPPRFDREIPEWTPEGMAKGAGNALITLAGLVEKLDGAVTEGDEIIVPEWAEGDSRKMVMAIHDIAGANIYIKTSTASFLTDSANPAAEWLALLDSPDQATRIGAAVMAIEWFPRSSDTTERHIDPILSRAKAMMKDADPDIRAAGTFMLNSIRGEAGEQLHPMILQALADPAWHVRLAAVIASLDISHEGQYLSEYRKLSEDSSAAVRLMGRAGQIASEYGGVGDPLPPAFLRSTVMSERNPVVRALLLIGSMQMLADPAAKEETAAFFANNEDPWIRAVSAPFLPLIRREGMPDVKGLVALLNSGKPSHDIIALGTLYAVHTASAQDPNVAAFLKGNALGELAVAKESGSLWRQYAVSLARCYVPGGAADDGLRESLCSPDEIFRIPNLFSATALRKEPLARDTLDQLTALSESPLLVEAYVAHQALVRNLPQEELLDWLRKAAAEAPDALNTYLLLGALVGAVPRSAPAAERNAFQEKIAEVLIESHNARLQAHALTRNIVSYQGNERNPTTDSFVRDMEPDALKVVLGGRIAGFYMSMPRFAYPVSERLTAMLESENPEVRSTAIVVLPRLLENVSRYGMRNSAETVSHVRALLDSAVTAWNADKENCTAAMLDTLNAIFTLTLAPQPILSWSETTAGLRSATVEALGYANHDRYGASAARFLGNLYALSSQWSMGIAPEKNDIQAISPLVWNAMESARWRITENGTERDRLAVLLGMSRSMTSEVRKAGQEEIGEMLVGGRVPQDLMPDAVAGVGERLGQLPAECARIAVDMVKRDDIAWDLRQRMVSRIASGAHGARHGKNEVPGWVDEVGRLGWTKATNEILPASKRKEWLRMHVDAAADAVSRARELICDVNQPLVLREAAAEFVPGLDLKSTIWRDLLPTRGHLGPEVQLALAKAATRSPEAPGSEEFFIAAITDTDIPASQRAEALRHVWLEWRSEKLRNVLTKLQEDPVMRTCVSEMLERMK